MSRLVEVWDEDEVNKTIELQQKQCRGRKLRRHINRNMGEVRESIKYTVVHIVVLKAGE